MRMIEISKATEEERQWVAALLAGSEPWTTLGISLEQCRRNCHNPEFLLFVAHLDQAPCGAMVLDPRGVAGSPYIKSIAVAAGFRGRSIGAELMNFAEELFRPEARHIFLCVSSFNNRARIFYERLGYAAVGEFPDYILEGASEILMHKRLK
jgi:[ribosomal protein S18]-alanine N-acetyltransferase